MVSNKPRPFIFVHIPRTGGTSVENAMLMALMRKHRPNDVDKKTRDALWANPIKPPNQWRMHASLNTLHAVFDVNRHWSFTIVRNPWDWVLSCIRWSHGVGLPEWKETRDLKARIKDYCFTPYRLGIYKTQLEYITVMGQIAVNYIAHYEELEKEFDWICRHLNFPKIVLPHDQKSRSTDDDYRNHYDEESAEWVAERFKDDIAAFNYSF